MLAILLVIFTFALLGVGFLWVRNQLSIATRLPQEPRRMEINDDLIKLTVRMDGHPQQLLLTQHEWAMAKERAFRNPAVFATTV